MHGLASRFRYTRRPMERRILGVLFIVSFFLWIASAFWTCGHARSGAETPQYTLIERHGKFEIRDYPELWLVAATSSSGPNFVVPKAAGIAGGTVRAAGRFAVYRYSGGRDAANEGRAGKKLAEWLTAHHWEAEEAPFFAYYDPAWVPTFFRRNEAMVRVHGGADTAR